MLVPGGFLVIFIIHGVVCSGLNDEYSVGTSISKYLYSPSVNEDIKKDEVGKNMPVWFGPRFGKRSQISDEELPTDILEIFEKIEKSPELYKLISERIQQDNLDALFQSYPQIEQRSRPFTPRYGRDAADANLHSRPYPPRFGRSSMKDLPPYLPRLG